MKNMLINNIGQLATPTGSNARKGKDMNKIKVIHNCSIYIENDTIVSIGDYDEVISQVNDLTDCDIINADGKCIIPGFVDSHTHFIFNGYRPDEFIERIKDSSYLEILKKGGGIQNTVNHTRSASFETLKNDGIARLNDMLMQGVTTVEGKSGYGLDKETELKQLQVSKLLNKIHPIDIVNTYLGAHAVPLEYLNNPDDYVEYIINTMIPLVSEKSLAEFCDVFCEDSVFSIKQSKRILTLAKKYNFKVKLHADEIVSLGGSELAADLKAISADHLLMISDIGIQKLIKNNVIATLLPCTAFCLGKPYAPARKIIDNGGSVALASDFNPGSCFTNSISLMLSLAVIHMHMTIEEALTALTLNGAAAIDRADSIGSIEPGKKADMVILKYPDYKFLVYNSCINIVQAVIKNGKLYSYI
jgi:imidazolonepropionase